VLMKGHGNPWLGVVGTGNIQLTFELFDECVGIRLDPFSSLKGDWRAQGCGVAGFHSGCRGFLLDLAAGRSGLEAWLSRPTRCAGRQRREPQGWPGVPPTERGARNRRRKSAHQGRHVARAWITGRRHGEDAGARTPSPGRKKVAAGFLSFRDERIHRSWS